MKNNLVPRYIIRTKLCY